jgi:hypothetical protein
MDKFGKFVISLDFELQWGMLDHVTKDSSYRKNIKAVHDVIPKLLEFFDKYGIHATFATVGLVFFENFQDLKAGLPQIRPTYCNQSINPYLSVNEIIDGVAEHYFLAPELIREIQQHPNMEIGSHTFSHYYCLEEGQTIDQFREDIAYAKKVASRYNIHLTSLVFPRNQINENYLRVCKELGFSSVRSNEKAWMYKASSEKDNTLFKRFFRLLDTYINVSGHHCYPLSDLKREPLVLIPASRFLRPYAKKLAFLDGLKLYRIKKEMLHAAKEGKLFHLWWHPHNFGSNTENNLIFLGKILEYYSYLHKKYNFGTCSMSDIVKLLK